MENTREPKACFVLSSILFLLKANIVLRISRKLTLRSLRSGQLRSTHATSVTVTTGISDLFEILRMTLDGVETSRKLVVTALTNFLQTLP